MFDGHDIKRSVVYNCLIVVIYNMLNLSRSLSKIIVTCFAWASRCGGFTDKVNNISFVRLPRNILISKFSQTSKVLMSLLEKNAGNEGAAFISKVL